MALYAALTFWLLVIMFTAWGVHTIWSGLVKPRIVNSVLLPGTLVAQLGHVLGLLISGSAVRNTQLMGDDDEGKPKTDTPEQNRLPIIGPILVGLLPLVACASCLYVATMYWGLGVIRNLRGGTKLLLPQELPTTLDGVWDLLRGAVDLVEALLDAVIASDLTDWQTAVFLYLAVCLTVRMAPFEGNRRGAIGAIFLAAVVIAVLGSVIPAAHEFVQSSWAVLSFTVGVLLFLLVVSLVVAGAVRFVRVLTTKE